MTSQLKFFGLFILALAALLVFSQPVLAANKLSFTNRYAEIKSKLANNPLGLPLWIESAEQNHIIQGDVYGIFDHPFEKVQTLLKEPGTWCDISLLHLNVKTCVHTTQQNQSYLICYNGRKIYQTPKDAYALEYHFSILEEQPDFLQIVLTATQGPLSTKDYQIIITAMPVETTKTFIHFSYAYQYGFIAHLAMTTYFATGGSSKIGFSVLNRDQKGNPVYVSGLRGAIERNAVRYYLAVQAYLDTRHLGEEERFKQCLGHWFDLTEQFKTQLFEMGKEEYIQTKLREHQNQLNLQMRVNQLAFKSGMNILSDQRNEFNGPR